MSIEGALGKAGVLAKLAVGVAGLGHLEKPVRRLLFEEIMWLCCGLCMEAVDELKGLEEDEGGEDESGSDGE